MRKLMNSSIDPLPTPILECGYPAADWPRFHARDSLRGQVGNLQESGIQSPHVFLRPRTLLFGVTYDTSYFSFWLQVTGVARSLATDR